MKFVITAIVLLCMAVSVSADELTDQQIRKWKSFSQEQKTKVASWAIKTFKMETADNPQTFNKHISAAVKCMDAGDHDMNMSADGATVFIGIIECSAKTYRLYCTICRN